MNRDFTHLEAGAIISLALIVVMIIAISLLVMYHLADTVKT